MSANYTACPACGALGEIGSRCLFCGTHIFLKEGGGCLKSRIVKHRTVTPQQYAERISIYHGVEPNGVIAKVNIGQEYGYINLNGELVYPLGLDENTRVLEGSIVTIGADKCIDLETLREFPYNDYLIKYVRKELGENNHTKYQEIFTELKQYIDEIEKNSSCQDFLFIDIKSDKILLGKNKENSHLVLCFTKYITRSCELSWAQSSANLRDVLSVRGIIPISTRLVRTETSHYLESSCYVINCQGYGANEISDLILLLVKFDGSYYPIDIKIEKLSVWQERYENWRKEEENRRKEKENRRKEEERIKEKAKKREEVLHELGEGLTTVLMLAIGGGLLWLFFYFFVF